MVQAAMAHGVEAVAEAGSAAAATPEKKLEARPLVQAAMTHGVEAAAEAPTQSPLRYGWRDGPSPAAAPSSQEVATPAAAATPPNLLALRLAGGAGCGGRRRLARTTGAGSVRASTPAPTGRAVRRRAPTRRGLRRLEPWRRPRRSSRAARRRRSRRPSRRRRPRRAPPKTRGRSLVCPRGGRRSGWSRGAGAGSRGCGSPSEASRPRAGARGGGRRRVCATPLRHRVRAWRGWGGSRVSAGNLSGPLRARSGRRVFRTACLSCADAAEA